MADERTVAQMRLVVEAEDYEAAVAFYARLGAPGGIQITIFEELDQSRSSAAPDS